MTIYIYTYIYVMNILTFYPIRSIAIIYISISKRIKLLLSLSFLCIHTLYTYTVYVHSILTRYLNKYEYVIHTIHMIYIYANTYDNTYIVYIYHTIHIHKHILHRSIHHTDRLITLLHLMMRCS